MKGGSTCSDLTSCLKIVVLLTQILQTIHGNCVQPGTNRWLGPKFIGRPQIEQLSLSKVRVSWEGIIERKECSEGIFVKYWRGNKPWDVYQQYADTLETNQFANEFVDIQVRFIFFGPFKDSIWFHTDLNDTGVFYR